MRILLVEDEIDLAKQIARALEVVGFTVDLADNGEDGRHLGITENYAAVVLDLGLPVVDGVTILRDWRREGLATPVLILTARGGWQDRVAGLNGGGDDYLTKPFHMEELIARIRALVRRAGGQPDSLLRAGDVELDIVSRAVTKDGTAVDLTANEFKVLATLMLQPAEVHSKTNLAETVYGLCDGRDSNTIEVFVARLRRKLGADLVETVRGHGYRIGA